MKERVRNLGRLLNESGTGAFFVTAPENRRYLSGFTGSAGNLLFVRDSAYLFTDFRYILQAGQETEGFQIIEATPGQSIDKMGLILKESGLAALAFESDHLTVAQYRELRDRLPWLELKPAGGQVESLRLCKDEGEVASIREAVRLADEALAGVLPLVRPGQTEREVALQLELFMRRHGAGRVAFDVIVASGPRAALPHGRASARVMREGDLVIMDFGAVWRGYSSDITRTVVLGRPDASQQEIYEIVLEAQQQGIKAVRAGIAAKEVDAAARGVIEWYGYGRYFGHSTGHGLGLNIHEAPRLSSTDETVLLPGMVVTVEPGIYLPGWGGVRIEDTVVVEENGCQVLTRSPKEQMISCS